MRVSMRSKDSPNMSSVPFDTTAVPLLLLLLISPTAAGQVKLAGRGGAQRFVSEKYKFSVAVPTGWSVRLSPQDHPVFVNYPASQDLPQLRLPKGGAMLSVLTGDIRFGARSPASPAEWAAIDMRNEAQTQSSPERFEMPEESEAGNAIVLSYDLAVYAESSQKQHRLAVYWQTGQTLFAAYLDCISDDPKLRAFEDVFRRTVRSLRPLRNRR